MYLFIIHLFPPVGGIHTSLRSKAKVTTAELGKNYCMIGIYNEPTVNVEVELVEPDLPCIREALEDIKSVGIKVRTIIAVYCIRN